MFKNKFIVILVILLLFTFVFCGCSFCSSTISDEKLNLINDLLDKYSCNFFISAKSNGSDIIYIAECSSELKFYGDYNSIHTTKSIKWYCFNYNSSSNSCSLFWEGYSVGHSSQNFTDISCNYTIYTDITYTDIFYSPGPVFKNPYIVNSLDSLSTWKFDNLWVDYGDYDINKTIYLHICKKTVDVSGVNSFYYTDSVIALSSKGKYYESYEDGLVYYFSIPKDNLSFTVSSGDKIIFYLSSSANNLGGPYSSDKPLVDSSIFDTKSFIIGQSYTEEDKQKDYQDKISSSLDDQKHAIEENTKTNKSIFEKIGDILSFINPFSENFFGKKLVELILDGLKSLFVPEDGFFDTYFSDLKNWFSDRLGFLWTPFDIIIEILNKILNINFSEPIFHIPEINEPFSGSKLISEYDYNLNSLLDNDVFNNIHNIYLFGVDAVIIFALINLARKKIEEVFSN